MAEKGTVVVAQNSFTEALKAFVAALTEFFRSGGSSFAGSRCVIMWTQTTSNTVPTVWTADRDYILRGISSPGTAFVVARDPSFNYETVNSAGRGKSHSQGSIVAFGPSGAQFVEVNARISKNEGIYMTSATNNFYGVFLEPLL